MSSPGASSSSALTIHKNLADQAFKAISAGLDREQHAGDTASALQYYRKGVKHLKAALKVAFPTQQER